MQQFGALFAVFLGMVSAAAFAEAPAPLSSFKDCDGCPEMVALPPGKFLMGASAADRKLADPYTIASELPQHEVTIAYPFALSRFEVSVADFGAYVAETGAKPGGECQIRAPDLGPNKGKFLGTLKPGTPRNIPGLVVITDGDFRKPGAAVSERHPAVCISRREAMAYLAWLSEKTGRRYRLPTEAEWEYAARAGSKTPFHYGGGLSDLCKYGNFADKKSVYGARIVAKCVEKPSPEGLAPIGSYQPNAWGLHDMIGNAFEFVEDCASENYQGAPNDGSAWRGNGKPCEFFTTRSYFFDSLGTSLRSAARCTAVDWDGRSNGLAIRVAVSLDEVGATEPETGKGPSKAERMSHPPGPSLAVKPRPETTHTMPLPEAVTGVDRIYTSACKANGCSVSALKDVRSTVAADLREVDTVTWTWAVDTDRRPRSEKVEKAFNNELTVSCDEAKVWQGAAEISITATAETGFRPRQPDVPFFDLWWAVCRDVMKKYSGG